MTTSITEHRISKQGPDSEMWATAFIWAIPTIGFVLAVLGFG